MRFPLFKLFSIFLLALCATSTLAQKIKPLTTIIPVDSGWANNSVNTVPFRKNSLVTVRGFQFISYYNNNGDVVLGKRKSGSRIWTLKKTSFKGNVSDAHNAISLMADGDGYLHMAWNHHDSP